ncbi:MAG: hypothetical protein V2A54_04565 [Bacteroidota bacterium]
MKKLRTLKLFFGSLLLGLFVSGCGNGKKQDQQMLCYDYGSAIDTSTLAKLKDDPLKKADSIHKSDSLKAKSKNKAKKTNSKNDPPPIIECYVVVFPNDSNRP